MISTNEVILIKEIKQHVAKIYSIPVDQLDKGAQWFPDVEARYVCFWMLDAYIFNTIPESYRLVLIGEMFGGKDRNTVRYGLKKINDEWLQTDKRFRKVFEEIKLFVTLNILENERINN